MTTHDSTTHGQRAFAAIHALLEAEKNCRVIVCDTPQEYTALLRKLSQAQIDYTSIWQHQQAYSEAWQSHHVPGVKVSVPAFIYLTTCDFLNKSDTLEVMR